MKSCIWCINPCEEYNKEIAVVCRNMADDDAQEYRMSKAHECQKYLTNEDDGLIDSIHQEDTQKPFEGNINIISCSINAYAQKNPACKSVVAGIATCPECGNGMCPVCHRHNITQLSRVTGYVGAVSGWNNAKKQELNDRKRYNIR